VTTQVPEDRGGLCPNGHPYELYPIVADEPNSQAPGARDVHFEQYCFDPECEYGLELDD
jgi:hypothetical protein